MSMTGPTGESWAPAAWRVHQIDPWTFYEYKPTFDWRHWQGTKYHEGLGPPFWVGEHWRRLQAYKLLDSYLRNDARIWQDPTIDVEEILARREYGDPRTIRDAILASLLGDDQSIIVAGAESNIASEREPDAQDQLSMLLDWMKKERFRQKMIETERNSVGLGDGVYVLGWDDDRQRPALTVFDPGFYFPVLTPDETGVFPEKVHIAWEYESWDPSLTATEVAANNMSGKRKFVRRLTYWLGTIGNHDENGVIVDADQNADATLFANEVEVMDNESGESYTLRTYPWDPDNPSYITCYYQDLVWEYDELGSRHAEDFDETKAIIRTPITDLGIDFLPVIHIPANVSEQEHFGTSVLANIMQIVDDLIATDTDLQAASATTGTPPIAVSNAQLPTDSNGRVLTYGPGTVWQTGEGTATMIDTSNSLKALSEYDDRLLERLAVNGRVPESLLGRVKPNEVPSGIALALSFTPHSQLIKEMRLVRDDKYSLLFKFIMRYFMANGVYTGAQIHDTTLFFGSFLPSDKSATATMVAQLLGTTPRPAISLETAVRMLVESGFPIEDAAAEIEKILSRDFAGADALLTATGNIPKVYDYLGLGPPPQPTFIPPPSNAPPQPPA